MIRTRGKILKALLYVSAVLIIGMRKWDYTEGQSEYKRHQMKNEGQGQVEIRKMMPADNWKPVRLNNSLYMYVYSAFFDVTYKPVIRVIAVGKRKQPVYNVSCVLYYENHTSSAFIPCKVKPIKEWHPSFYTSKWLECDAPDEIVPSTVQIISSGMLNAQLKVHHPRSESSPLDTISVCVRPFHNSFNNFAALIEFIEYYQLVGASHFTFYNQSIGTSTSRTLDYYRHKGTVTVLHYDLPVYNQTVADGQYTVLQDCYLRSRGLHKYVAMVDVDEFIFPRNVSTLQEVMAIYEDKQIAGFYFASLTYCKDFQRNKTILGYLQSKQKEMGHSGDPSLTLVTQELTMRANNPCPIPDKSKMIIDPWRIDETGVHFVSKAKKDYALVHVDPSVAMVHHYRSCPDDRWLGKCPRFPNPEADVYTHKYLKILTNRVLEVYRDIGF